jgi:dienelactone hydrolase
MACPERGERVSIPKRNAEHYPDPTAYKALVSAMKGSGYRPLVYIASPFAGDTEINIRRARGYCRFAVQRGYIPIAPHLLFPQFMDDNDGEERELALFFGFVLLSKCKELWVIGSRVSAGMLREIRYAERRGIPIRRFDSRCREVLSR